MFCFNCGKSYLNETGICEFCGAEYGWGTTLIDNDVEVSSGSSLFGRYYIGKMIGSCVFYKMYLADDKETGEKVCVKVIDKRSERIYDYYEMYIFKQLKSSHAPEVYEIFQNETILIAIMKCLEGKGLNKVVCEQGLLDEKKVVNWTKQLCNVLKLMHGLNPPLIHCDVTSNNVLVTPDETIVLLGYDLVRSIDSKEQCIGTRGYIAPEQFSGKADFRTDIYAVGAVMYFMLTGQAPEDALFRLRGGDKHHQKQRNSLEYIIEKCMDLNPDKRYQTCEELLKDLNNLENLPPKKGFLKDLLK